MSFVQEKIVYFGGKYVKISNVMTRVERERVTFPFGLSLISLLKIKLIHMYFVHTGQIYT